MADAEPMDVERELFKLSATLAGHEQDVRCVGALANNQVLTGSRDSSVRVWAPAPSTDGFSYACTSTLLGHSHYVGTLTATPLDGLASGSNDKHVIEWDLAPNAPARVLEGRLLPGWCELLGTAEGGPTDNFFDLGGHSLLASKLVAAISREIGVKLSVLDLFDAPSVRDLARKLAAPADVPKELDAPVAPAGGLSKDVAIVGMAGRFPQAPSVDDFWSMLVDGRDALTLWS